MVNLFRNESGQWYIYKLLEGWTIISTFLDSPRRMVDLHHYLHSQTTHDEVFDKVVKNLDDLSRCYQFEPGGQCVNLVTGKVEFDSETSREWLERVVFRY